MDIAYIWLLAGVAFLATEALGVSGIGLMFAGLGALVVGLMVNAGLIEPTSHVSQFIVFFASTAVWAVLLWKPIQKLKLGKKHQSFSNIVGDTAIVVGDGLRKGVDGEVSWSGTTMKAELSAHAHVESLAAGAHATIVDMVGAKLIVTPKA